MVRLPYGSPLREASWGLREPFGINDSVTTVRHGKWQPACYADHDFSKTFRLEPKRSTRKQLRFSPIRIAEWMGDLLDRGVVQNRIQLAEYRYVSRTRADRHMGLLGVRAS